jgi:hypothetical protein
VYGYVVRPVLPPIRTIFQIVSFRIKPYGILGRRERKYLYPSTPTPTIPAETAYGSGVAVEVEAVVVDEPKRKCQKVKGRPRHAVVRN